MTATTQPETTPGTIATLCDVCGMWYDGPEENHWHEVVLEWLPTWHAPAITRLGVTRTMAWCGSQDVAGGEE